MSYLKDLSKKPSSSLSTSTQNTYSDPREKTILVLSKIIRFSGMEVLPKEGKAIYLKTEDIKGGRFYLKVYLKGRKNYLRCQVNSILTEVGK